MCGGMCRTSRAATSNAPSASSVTSSPEALPHGMTALALADRVNLLMGARLDVHVRQGNTEHARQVLPHGVLDWSHPRLLQYQGGIQVGNLIALLVHQPPGLVEELLGVRSPPPRVVVGKELADVGEAQSTEDGICGRVVEHVAVGVRLHAEVALHLHAADHAALSSLLARRQAVDVPAVADVGEAQSTEDGICGRVVEHVAVGVRLHAEVALHLHAADHAALSSLLARRQAVDVPAVADVGEAQST
eukprot:CAMPEP_0171196342 /NCGR_PEP_ID=MMETSP0790-20130122/21853_1 /TAXON_ID=2925 /ORGANISM="Alexandrium catenella, Strain OF101" /LENGTH=246 /DNA_ID=CAMNT_0011661563 /DNA_START=165 /DNA_END=902 /DNA_ORIENTATION=+